jgi:predicted ABC-type ATPase
MASVSQRSTDACGKTGCPGWASDTHVVIRRYAAGLKNLQRLYLPIADIAYIYDNTDEGGILIAERQPGQDLVVRDNRRWRHILEANRD